MNPVVEFNTPFNSTRAIFFEDGCYPEELVIPYIPINDSEMYHWIETLDVLRYLLLHPEDRNQLRIEACRRDCWNSRTFFVQHPHLNCLLPIGSLDSDYLFVRTIKHQIITLERQAGNFNPPLLTILHPLQNPFILDPFNLLPDHSEISKRIATLIPYPCEILVLPGKESIRRLLSYETIV